jgi:thiosulfate dehydrogenase [quinone] large subunit
MSTQSPSRDSARLPDPNFVHPEIVAPETTAGRVVRYTAVALRLGLGWIFLWAFLDKTFGLGHDTSRAQAWIHGSSPTKGFLSFGATGPFESFYHSISGQAWADWLFMAGLLGLGVALIAGIAMRLAAAAGTVLMVMMWSVTLPPANNVFMDDHLVYAMILILLAAAGAGSTLGLGKAWESLPLVKRNGWLR